MPERDRRQKASDVFRESEFLFAEKGTFDEAFPEIEDLRVEVTERGEGFSEPNRKSTYVKETFPGEYIDCSNAICYNGGFSIGSILRGMVRKTETELETYQPCQGYKGSPKGRRKYGRCPNAFSKVSIKYKQEKDRQQ